jgi:ERCC4-type nuclease
VIVDTREQEPYAFNPALVTPVRRALPAGDYSITGLETVVAVERKSMDDFVDTVVHARERFYRELSKLARYRRSCVVVEGGIPDLLAGDYRGRARPGSVFGSAVAITVDFGVPVFFCSTRPAACRFVETYLLRAEARRDQWQQES